MPPPRVVRVNATWSDLSCSVTGFDADHRVIGSMTLELDPKVQQGIAQTQGSGWKVRVEDQLRNNLQTLLNLRYR